MSLQIQNLSPDSAYFGVEKRNRCGQTNEKPTMELVENIAKSLSERLGENLLGFIVFGSVAAGDQTRKSDLDLFLLVKNKYPALRKDIESSLETAADKQEIVLTVASPQDLFTALNTQDPFLLAIFEKGKVLIDNWYLNSLKQAIVQSRTPASKLTAKFLIDRAESRLNNAKDDIVYIKKTLLACFADIGFGLCHLKGEVAFTKEEILEILKAKEGTPKSFTEVLEAKLNSRPEDEKLDKLLAQTEQFIEEAQGLIKSWESSFESTN